MTCEQDNVDTKTVALITLVGVAILALAIVGADAAYSYANAVFAPKAQAGQAGEVQQARAAWQQRAEAKAQKIPGTDWVHLPLTEARARVLAERTGK